MVKPAENMESYKKIKNQVVYFTSPPFLYLPNLI